MFFGRTATDLAEGRRVPVHRANRRDAAGVGRTMARLSGVAAVFEAASCGGMSGRVLSSRGGERHADRPGPSQLLQDGAVHRDNPSRPARLVAQATEGAAPPNTAAASTVTPAPCRCSRCGPPGPTVSDRLPAVRVRAATSGNAILSSSTGMRSAVCTSAAGQFSSVSVRAEAESASGDQPPHLRRALTQARSRVVIAWRDRMTTQVVGLSRLLRSRARGSAVPTLSYGPGHRRRRPGVPAVGSPAGR